MHALLLGVGKSRVRLVSDGDYESVVRSLISGAQRHCLGCLSVIDLYPVRDPKLRIDSILCALRRAMLRGVYVRFVVGGSRTKYELAATSLLAEMRAAQLGLPLRWLTRASRRSSPIQLVVADDHVLTGSHNWSLAALSRLTQDSVLVHSPDLAAYGIELIESMWLRAGGKRRG